MTTVAQYLWALAAGTLMLFLVLATALASARLPRMAPHPLAVHVGAVVLIWVIGIGIDHNAPAPPAAYLVTLAAIWNYRHRQRLAATLAYRLGQLFTAVWCLAGLALLVHAGHGPQGSTGLLTAWLFALLGLAPWFAGWLVQRRSRGSQRFRVTLPAKARQEP